MSSHLKIAVSSDDHIQGDSNAPLELVEYGDYQCPHCGRAYPVIKAIQEKLKGDLKFVFRNFPLSDVHPDAFNAAMAAEAAALQNKFWQMHDIIFENQDNLDSESLLSYAKKIGLDIHRFKDDVKNNSLSDKIENDFEGGVRSGVNGTPSFYINGAKYEGAWDDERNFLQDLKSLLIKTHK
jgi:protein-disulfide isomerase